MLKAKVIVCRSNALQKKGQLVHSSLCTVMYVAKSEPGGGEYFVTFIDDHWINILSHKNEVFPQFLEWKAHVEKSTGQQVKTLRSDNGGEYTSREFTSYLTKEEIKHKLTIPHTPQGSTVHWSKVCAQCLLIQISLGGGPLHNGVSQKQVPHQGTERSHTS